MEDRVSHAVNTINSYKLATQVPACYFTYIFRSDYYFSSLSSCWIVIAVCGSISVSCDLSMFVVYVSEDNYSNV